MLSNLASYLGYSSAIERTPANVAAAVTADVRLRDEEDDWVLVEANERDGGVAQPPELDDESGVTRVTVAISTSPAALLGTGKNLSKSVSLDISCPLQESWYLTPPPSFSSEGPVHMETSPLENMLIEHPSMSVYERTSRRNSSTAVDEEPPSSPSSSIRPPSPSRLARKEKLSKITRNKMNAKLSKKISKRVNEDGVTCEVEEKTLEAKEPKIKNFSKSPRRPHRVPCGEPFNEMISESEKCTAEVQVVPTRKLYSEVLAGKPEPAPAPAPAPAPVEEPPQPEPVPEVKEQEVPETVAAPAAVESESVMSVEETPEDVAGEEERTDSVTDRPRTIQSIIDPQQRQNFLTRSAQKVEQRKTCDLMKRNPLIRTNKAREINFRNKRQRRADMMQRHSGANNNRKC